MHVSNFWTKGQDYKEYTIPVSSAIKLDCYDGLRVNNITVTIRRSPTTCVAKTEKCTLPIHTIETIKETCNKQASCKVDIRNITNNISCLQEYGYFNVWYTCNNILDSSCDFESDMCNWSILPRKARFRWTYGHRSRTKNPAVDHTSASTTGKYMYIYSSDNSVAGDIAELESGPIIATDHQCLSFWYFTTNSIDSVQIFQNRELLLNLTNNYEYIYNKWNYIYLPLEMISYNPFNLVFRVTRGLFDDDDEFSSSIAIDDILIENHSCNTPILNCNFEKGLCDWNIIKFNQYVWKRQTAKLQSDNKGPETDHTTASDGHYIYFGKPSEDVTKAMDYYSYLEYQDVNLPAPGNFCLTFWYHMFDEDYGKERLNVTFDDEIVWSSYGNRDNKWKKGEIDLRSRNTFSINFIGIFRGNSDNAVNIAVDDISLTKGTCKGLCHQKELCVQLDDKMPLETECPKHYLDIKNQRLSFDPEKNICSDTYEETKMRLSKECENRDDSQKCNIDLSIDKSFHPECFQLYDFNIMHTCEDEEPTTISSVITSNSYSSADEKPTTVSSDSTSRMERSVVSSETFTAARVMGNSSDSETGLVVGLIIGAVLLVCVVIVIIVLIRRQTFKSDQRENIRTNPGGNDYIGSQDIALPLTANDSRHMQNTGIYNGSSDTRVHGYDSINSNVHNNNVEHEYTNLGAAKGFVNDENSQVPTYAHRWNKSFADNHMSNDDEYAIVDPTAERSLNESADNKTGTDDCYMVLDPTQTGFNRQISSNTPVDYEFAKPVKDTSNKSGEEDQYAVSEEGVYDHSGNNRHRESDVNIYNHAVDNIYDSGSHKRNDEERKDTYAHFVGQNTDDVYYVSTTT